MATDLAALAARLAEQTQQYPFKVWGFGEGIALEALWEASHILGDARWAGFVNGIFERWLAREPRLTEADHSAPGELLLTVYEARHDSRLLALARGLAAHMQSLPVELDSGARLHRPQHPDYHDYLYVDCMEVDAPFLCKLAVVTGETALYADAARQILGYSALLFDQDAGLFNHQYDRATGRINGAFWGRGNGWALLGLLKTLRLLPVDHPAYAPILTHYQRLAGALAAQQSSDGTWPTVIDRPETYAEASLPAMFGWGLAQGIRHGLLSPEYTPVVRRAWEAVAARLGDGLLPGVSIATPPGDAAHYNRIATGAGYPWGQGPALLLCLTRLTAPELFA
jgi:unsaturated rhamnogalacturonyl hydrolase